MARLAGRLPKGEANGLTSAERDLIQFPDRPVVCVVVLDTQKITTDVDTGDVIATARVGRIERVLPADLGTAEQLLRRALEKRSGGEVLPLDLEDEITAIFADAANGGELEDEEGKGK
ncbi:hypothetical protein ACFWH7_03435 [Cellulosimicrobium cellulans]|uniref:hypothetical protein n=1 Tax=Cellulosimicrobium cellulans TaxID=1710 RepID=UPI003665B840